jgi:hypothetical protein
MWAWRLVVKYGTKGGRGSGGEFEKWALAGIVGNGVRTTIGTVLWNESY